MQLPNADQFNCAVCGREFDVLFLFVFHCFFFLRSTVAAVVSFNMLSYVFNSTFNRQSKFRDQKSQYHAIGTVVCVFDSLEYTTHTNAHSEREMEKAKMCRGHVQ